MMFYEFKRNLIDEFVDSKCLSEKFKTYCEENFSSYLPLKKSGFLYYTLLECFILCEIEICCDYVSFITHKYFDIFKNIER